MIAPTRTYPPCFHLWREVHDREWSVMDFARRSELGFHAAYSLLLGGKIDFHGAIGLALAFGNTPKDWLDLQKEWEEENVYR